MYFIFYLIAFTFMAFIPVSMAYYSVLDLIEYGISLYSVVWCAITVSIAYLSARPLIDTAGYFIKMYRVKAYGELYEGIVFDVKTGEVPVATANNIDIIVAYLVNDNVELQLVTTRENDDKKFPVGSMVQFEKLNDMAFLMSDHGYECLDVYLHDKVNDYAAKEFGGKIP